MTHFLPPNYEQYLFSQFQYCIQGNRSVLEYNFELLPLLSRNNVMESKNQLVSRYFDGLKDSINDEIGCYNISNLSEPQNLAVKAELRLSLKKNTLDESSHRAF